MADTKISALPSGAPAQAGDEYVIARSGANYKLTLTNIAASMPPIGATTPNTGAFTTLSASGAASFADGSASAPAVTNTGDTDTGVYFPAANEVAVTTGGTVAAGFNSNGLFFRNRIINGDMRIDQRNAGASVAVPAGQSPYTVDRFALSNSTDGAASAQQDSSSPSGFVNSIKITTTTADATLTTTQNLQFYQNIEGTNIADLAWGTASARTVTLSFWVRSSLTGTFGGSLRNSSVARSYPFAYSISVADTWEYKTVTIPGDTSGTWLTTTGVGIIVSFGLGVGPDRSGTAGAWASVNAIAPTGAVSVIGTLNATWYVTGVQLETGSVATPFERRPYGTELQLCQRYCQKLAGDTASMVVANGWQSSTTAGTFTYNFGNPMRAAPTLTTGTVGDFYARNQSIISNLSTFALDGGVNATKETVSFSATWAAAGGAAGFGAQLVSGVNTPRVILSAEL